MRKAEVKGVELSANYDNGPWSVYRQPRLVRRPRARNINSAQFNFEPAELAFIASNWIYPRPQPELDRLGRRRLHLQPGHRLGDAGLGRRALRQRPAHRPS